MPEVRIRLHSELRVATAEKWPGVGGTAAPDSGVLRGTASDIGRRLPESYLSSLSRDLECPRGSSLVPFRPGEDPLLSVSARGLRSSFRPPEGAVSPHPGAGPSG